MARLFFTNLIHYKYNDDRNNNIILNPMAIPFLLLRMTNTLQPTTNDGAEVGMDPVRASRI